MCSVSNSGNILLIYVMQLFCIVHYILDGKKIAKWINVNATKETLTIICPVCVLSFASVWVSSSTVMRHVQSKHVFFSNIVASHYYRCISCMCIYCTCVFVFAAHTEDHDNSHDHQRSSSRRRDQHYQRHCSRRRLWRRLWCRMRVWNCNAKESQCQFDRQKRQLCKNFKC